MSLSIDDIWNSPIEDSLPRSRKDALASTHDSPARPSPAKRRRTTLFLSSDSENDAPKLPYRKRSPPPSTENARQKSAVDALFDDIDDLDDNTELAPSLDIEKMRRQAEARHKAKIPALTPHQILPSSSPPRDLGPDEETGGINGGKGRKKDKDDGLHKRKPKPKLDETRLLDKDGFPALAKQTKDFVPRGKGHELSDLNKLMTIYQFWTHKLYPRQTFHDNVQRIERLCHTKRMHNALGMIRDESKGLVNGLTPEQLEAIGDQSDDSDSDAEDQRARAEDSEHAARSVSPTPQALSPVTRSSSPPTRPPSSVASERPSVAPPRPPSAHFIEEDDFDVDAMIAEDEERQAAESNVTTSKAPTASTSVTGPPPPDEDEDQEMWDQFGDFDDALVQPTPPLRQPTSKTAPQSMDLDADDDDMWDIVREMESSSKPAAPPPSTTLAKPLPAPTPAEPRAPTQASAVMDDKVATNEEGWDEMYL